MIKILVTGSKGQLGSEINKYKELVSDVIFLFHDIDTLDITNKKQFSDFVKNNNPKYIVNCAAYTAVDKAESEIEKAMLINSDAVQIIASAAQENNSYLIHISTDYVFDGTKNTPYVEDDVINPISAYGKSKAEGEKFVAFDKGMIIRTAWLYSSFGNNIVKTILRLGKERPSLGFVFDQVGSPTYAGDLAHSILAIIDSIEKGKVSFKSGIFHYSNEGVCSWYDFATTILKLAKLPCKVNPIETKDYPTPATRPVYSVFNKIKIKSTYNILVPYWKDSLEKCLKELGV